MTRSSSDIYRTANLTLASYLCHQGMLYELVRGEGRSATWEFDRSQVAEPVAEFESGGATVEPQAFHHSITKTRRMLFDFINGTDERWDAKFIENHDPARPGKATA